MMFNKVLTYSLTYLRANSERRYWEHSITTLMQAGSRVGRHGSLECRLCESSEILDAKSDLVTECGTATEHHPQIFLYVFFCLEMT